MKKIILSGMRPTGKLHLGHLLGAISNWVELEKSSECLFMVADWHALMSEYENPAQIKDNSIECAIDWIACGIDPKKSVIFLQSEVREHLDLAMVFSVLTPLSWLERCPTYKEQLRELAQRNLTTYGFLGYPVLQAADILLYHASHVPIGVDQLPHLELTREIARRFNHIYKKNLFKDPEPILTKVPKLLGLDGRKMSKSYDNTIAFGDSDAVTEKKVSSMFTDPKRQRLTDVGHPDICNVFSYWGIFASGETKAVRDWCENAELGCTECKKRLSGKINECLTPIRKKRAELSKDKNKIIKILKDGSKKAAGIANKTMVEVRKLTGLLELT